MSMIIFLLLIIGVVALFGLPVDLFPEMEFPIAAILINYAGVGPQEIESLIAQPIENIIGTIPNVESITSTSRTGGGLIVVNFHWGTDMNMATLEIRERLDMVREALPEGAAAPTVIKFDPRQLPIMHLAVSSEQHDITETRRIVEHVLQPQLEPVDGVASISVEGGRENEVRVLFDPFKLNHYNLTLQQIQQLMTAENLNIPAGLVEEGDKELPLTIRGQFKSLDDIKNIKIPTQTGEIITVTDIAVVKETYKPTHVLSFLNGEESIGVKIQKQADANTVRVARGINNRLETIADELPDGIIIEPIFDQAVYIKQSVRTVAISILIGGILAGLILFLFLKRLKSTLIVAIAIPLSIITTFIFMYFGNQSLNLLTLGGLALGVGMMVDNAIVILENIHRFRQNGYSLKDAAVKGTTEVGPAVIASTLTTVVVFIPIVFVEGLAAQLFKPLALTVSFALLASLFTSLIFVPLLASKLIVIDEEESSFQRLFNRMRYYYKSALRWSLTRPKKVFLAVLLLFGVSLAGIPLIGQEFLPHLDESVIYMDIRLPVGSSFEQTVRMTEIIDEKLKDIPEIRSLYVTVGGVGEFQVGAGTLANRANYTIPILPVTERTRTDLEIADDIRQRIKHLPDIRISLQTGSDGLGGSPVSLNIRGPDFFVLEALSEDIMSIIANIDGITEIQSDFTRGQAEMAIIIDRFKAAQYGITTAEIARAINETKQGLNATRLLRGGEELDIRLLIEGEDITQLQRLKNVAIPTRVGPSVPLAHLVEFEETTGPHTIRRVDRMRQVTVTAQLLNRDLGTATNEIRQALEDELKPRMPSGYSIHFGGQNEEMVEAFQKLSAALALAIVLVYMIMSAQFESYFFPFIIMFTVPLIAIGVIFGLLLTNRPLGVGAMIGLLILVGIVVNNAIVFIAYVNTLRKEGFDRDEALLTAGPVRLRPIAMTALTTILGLIPLMLGFGEGAEIQAPMATVVIFGLFVASLITLFFIPVTYKLLDEWRGKRENKTIAES